MPTMIWVLLGIASLTLFLWFVAQGQWKAKFGGTKSSSAEKASPDQPSGQQ